MEPIDQQGPQTIDLSEPTVVATAPDQRPSPRPRTLLAGIASLSLLALMYALNNAGDDEPTATSRAASERSEVVEVQMMGKIAAALLTAVRDTERVAGVLDNVEVRTVRGRAAKIAVLYALGLGEIATVELSELQALMEQYPEDVSERDVRLAETLETLVFAEEQEEITPEQEDFLVEELGWCGKALLARKHGDRDWLQAQGHRAAGVLGFLMLLLFLVAVLFVVGVVLWIRLLYLSAQNPDHLRFAPSRIHPGFHLEAFAAVLALVIAGQAVLPALFPEPLTGVFLTHGLALLGLLVLRRSGAGAATWLADVGLHIRQLFGRLLEGIGVYAMALPALFVGGTYTFLLSRFSPQLHAPSSPLEPLPQPSHPAIDVVLEGNVTQLVLIFLTAVVGAPILEEILFRGLLYRFFRGYTSFFSRGWSIFWSALLTAFIFAVIHPQGLLAVPALTGLAAGFAVGRERYGSLIPCMVAHALNNAVVLSIVFLIALS